MVTLDKFMHFCSFTFGKRLGYYHMTQMLSKEVGAKKQIQLQLLWTVLLKVINSRYIHIYFQAYSAPNKLDLRKCLSVVFSISPEQHPPSWRSALGCSWPQSRKWPACTGGAPVGSMGSAGCCSCSMDRSDKGEGRACSRGGAAASHYRTLGCKAGRRRPAI